MYLPSAGWGTRNIGADYPFNYMSAITMHGLLPP